jgi:hypothetical protein
LVCSGERGGVFLVFFIFWNGWELQATKDGDGDPVT